MRDARSKALAAARIQWEGIVLLALAMIPPATMIFRARENSLAAIQNRPTPELIGMFGSIMATAFVQTFILRDGSFGVCAIPPLRPLASRSVFWLRVGTQGFFCITMAVGALTLLRWLPMHLGMVLSFGLICLNFAILCGLSLALGYDQVVPRPLRFFFAMDKMWIMSRLRGRLYRGERSCVAAMKDEGLPVDQRLFAMELIALRPWVPGGQEALREISHAEGVRAPLAARAREILAGQTDTGWRVLPPDV